MCVDDRKNTKAVCFKECKQGKHTDRCDEKLNGRIWCQSVSFHPKYAAYDVRCGGAKN